MYRPGKRSGKCGRIDIADYLDSSVLVAACLAEDASHEAADRAVAQGGFTSTHALAEAYATLSGRLRLNPYDVRDVVMEKADKLKVVALDESDYRAVVEQAPKIGVRGGAVFDALHVHAARKAKAARLIHADADYLTLAPDIATALADA